MESSGESSFGQWRVQLPWLWQLWQPPETETAASTSARPASRSSFTTLQARLRAAGPR